MDVSASLIPDHETAKAMEPRDRSLDDPAMAPEARVRVDLRTRDARRDPARSARSAVGPRAVPLVSVQLRGTAARASDAPRDGDHAVEHGRERPLVRGVRRRQPRGTERDALRVGEYVVLAAGTAAVRRVRAGLFAPLFAGTWEESRAARLQSMRSAA